MKYRLLEDTECYDKISTNSGKNKNTFNLLQHVLQKIFRLEYVENATRNPVRQIVGVE